jgi:hypothetical protein
MRFHAPRSIIPRGLRPGAGRSVLFCDRAPCMFLYQSRELVNVRGVRQPANKVKYSSVKQAYEVYAVYHTRCLEGN